MKTKLILFFAATALLCMDVQAKKKVKTPTADTTKSEKKAKAGTIESVITDKAVRQDGMFTVFNQEGKYYFLVPTSLLGKDILVVNRLSQSAAGLRSGFSGYGGDQIYDAMVRFNRSPDSKRLFIEKIKTRELPRDTTGAMYQSVMRSNVQPILESFEIKAQSRAKDSMLIEVTDLLLGDNELIAFDPSVKSDYKISSPRRESSYVKSVKTFPTNTEIQTVKTYMSSPENPFSSRPAPASPATFVINSSFLLLPDVPMQPRYADARVGYFTERYTDFDQNPQGVKNLSMITRWRLEPKPEDVEKYKRGELVEPIKPIVYYIDPATPEKWVSYLIQGVNDWEPVFRKAGFKNAIRGERAPVGDSTWSLEDARYSAIVYKPSTIPNASGPHNGDPRSGEIIESHVNWYHNVMLLLRNWYMLQAGPNDPRARQLVFPDELMGELIRFVSSHEIGHTLGLRHNFGATSLTPVDSLRSRTFLKKHGHTPSIMDYSRFNYVVQPEDGIEPELQYPRIAEYDEWAIEWGYRRFPELATPQAEATKLNEWIIEKNKNPRLWFGHESNRDDPRSQAEDLGDDQMKANELGIRNLQRVMLGLPEWTKEANEGYSALASMYNGVITQFNRYLGHVSKWVGGVYENPMTLEQGSIVYRHVEKEKQKQAISFLEKQLFNAPQWLLSDDIFRKTGLDATDVMARLYGSQLSSILSTRVLTNLINAEATNGSNSYTQGDLYNDLNRIIFSGTPDVYRRILQKNYISTLIDRSELSDQSGAIVIMAMGLNTNKMSDVQSFAAYQLKQLQTRISAMHSTDPVVKAHYDHLVRSITKAFATK